MMQLHFADLEVGATLSPLQMTVTTTAVVSGAMATRDYSPLHHDHRYAVETAGHKDIFLNTPHQAAIFQRLLTDNLGPLMRLGRLRIAMKQPVYAGSEIEVLGQLQDKQVDDTGCGWLEFELALHVAGELASQCSVRCALPVNATDNPWQRRGREWQP